MQKKRASQAHIVFITPAVWSDKYFTLPGGTVTPNAVRLGRDGAHHGQVFDLTVPPVKRRRNEKTIRADELFFHFVCLTCSFLLHYLQLGE